MVRFRAFFPACGDGTFYGWILLLYVVDELGIHIVGSGGFRIKSECIVELSEDIIHDGFLIFHGEHPDAEILGLIFFTELFTGKSEERERDLVTVFFVIFLRNSYRFLVEERSVCHLNRDLETVLMGQSLLCFKDVQRFYEKARITEISFFSLSCNGCGVLRNHFGAMNDVYNEFTHDLILRKAIM